MCAACRTPAHCIEYAHLIQWNQQRTGEEFDTDKEEHMKWVYDKAIERAKQFGIQVCLQDMAVLPARLLNLDVFQHMLHATCWCASS